MTLRPERPPFDELTLTLGARSLGAATRKARNKSQGNLIAARRRMLSYSKRDPQLAREMVRQAIWKAAFTVAVTGEFPAPGAVPDDMDPAPFTDTEFSDMRDQVQRAADAALSGAAGDVGAARLAMWADAESRPELASALAGLLILALGR